MYQWMKNLIKDLEDENLPKNLDNYDKIKCSLVVGKRIYWYGKEDKEFLEGEGEDARKCLNSIYSGIIIGRHDVDANGELDVENVIVVMDKYPVEKDYCQYTWLALNRLLDDEDLIEIFDDTQ